MHRAAFGDDPVLAEHARRRRRIRLARARRRAHVDARRDRQAAARRARQHASRPTRNTRRSSTTSAAPHDAARPVRVRRSIRRRRSRSTRSSRRPRSSSASPPARCRSARSRTEAHATLAVAMNRIGGKRNTGEGGEDPARYRAELKGIPIAEGTHVQRHHRQGRHRRRLRAEGRRLAALEDQAGRVGPLRRHDRIPGLGRPDPDQDGAGRQAGRGRPAAGRQGQRVHRPAALLGAGRRPDLAAAAPRHLFDRGPGAADPRPEERQPAREHQRQAGLRSGRRHDRRRRRQGQGRPRRDRRPRRRHRRLAVDRRSSTPARPGSSAWPRRSRRWC